MNDWMGDLFHVYSSLYPVESLSDFHRCVEEYFFIDILLLTQLPTALTSYLALLDEYK